MSGIVDIAAQVIANRRLSDDYNVLELDAPAIAAQAAPGQSVMIKAAAPPTRCCAALSRCSKCFAIATGRRQPSASSANESGRRRACCTRRSRAMSCRRSTAGAAVHDRRPLDRRVDGCRRRRAGAVCDAGGSVARAWRRLHPLLRRPPRRRALPPRLFPCARRRAGARDRRRQPG